MISTESSQLTNTSFYDVNERLKGHILWYILARIVVFTFLLGITFLLQSKGHLVILPSATITIAFISIVYIYSIGSAVILQTIRTKLRRFGVYQFVLDAITSALLVYATGCSQSIYTPLFILPIITGGLILYTIGGLIPATASTLLYATVLVLEYMEKLPPYFFESHYRSPVDPLASMNIFSIYGILFFLTGFLSGMLGNRLKFTEAALSLTSRQLDRISVLYQQIFNDISTGIITVDARERITSLNPAAEKISGFNNEEIVGYRLSKFFPELIQKDFGRRVGDLQKKGGELTRIVYSFSTLNIKDNKTLQGTDYNSWKIITLEDISKIEQMEKTILEAQNMAAIGELSANIAHDFRNPIAAIYGSAQIISLELESEESKDLSTQQRLTGIILRESERMADTVTEFLQFARPSTLSYHWFDMKRLIEETITLVKTNNEKYLNYTFKYTIIENLDVWGDRQQLQVALKHLLVNSCNASSGNPDEPIKISYSDAVWTGKNIITLEVTDQGTGIKPEYKEKMFEPFFSTSEQGTGLGLSIVQQIVNRHNGEVECQSTLGKGCTFILRLPLPGHPEDIFNEGHSEMMNMSAKEDSSPIIKNIE